MTANQLKVTRTKKGLSQFAVATAAKVSRYKISLFETGYGDLTKDEVKRIKRSIKNANNKG